MAKRMAAFFLLLGAAILLLGAFHMFLSFQAYAIGGCFLVSAVMLIALYFLPRKKKKDKSEK